MKVSDENRRIQDPDPGSGTGYTPKCHGSATLQERILCEVNGGGCSSSSSSSSCGSEAAEGAEEAQLGGGLARDLRQQVKEGIYRLLSEGSEASSLGQYPYIES